MRSRRSKRAVQPLEGEEDDEDLPRDIAASIQVGSRPIVFQQMLSVDEI